MADNNTKFTKGITVKENSLTPKEIEIIPGGTADTKTTVQGSQTVDRTITLPDANDTLVGKATVDILTNKTIDANGAGNSISNLEVADLAAGVLNTSTTLAGASDLQIPSALAAKSYIDAHINDATDAHDASAISVIPSGNLTSTDVQSALVELQTEISSATGGLSDHITDPTGAHAASAISVSPTGNLGSTEVQAALVELQLDIDSNSTNIANHITDTIDAHDASAISVVPTGNLAADDVQEALVELQTDVDTRATTTALTTHTSASSGVHGVTGAVVGTTDTQSLSNKTITASDIDGGTASNTSRITLPKAAKATLDGLTRKEGTVVYASDEDKVYYDDGTVLKPVGSGSGGSINFITNPDGSTGTTGWTEGSYTAAARPSGTFTPSSGAGAFAISTTTTTPLGTGTTSFLLTKSAGASRQGRAVVSDFVLPLDYRAKVLKIDVNYIINSGTFVAGSNTTDSSLIWYAAFSTDNGATYTVAEPSSFKLLSNSTTISDRFSGSIQTPHNATNMRLIAYVAETANSAWVVECITSVSPSQYVYGTPIITLPDYTPAISHASGTMTGYTITASARKDGGYLHVDGKISINSATTGTWSELRIGLPAGLSIDTNVLKGDAFKKVGYGSYVDSGNYASAGVDFYYLDATRVEAIFNRTLTGTNPVYIDVIRPNQNVPMTWTTNDFITFRFSVPILGWSSSVQMSDSADTRIVNASASNFSSTSVTAGTPVTFTGVNYDSHGGFKTLGAYTVLVQGYYDVKLTGVTSSTMTGCNFEVKRNGSSGKLLLATAGTAARISGSNVIYANAGDLLTIVPDTTGSLNSASSIEVVFTRISGPSAIAAQETIGALYTGAPPTGTLNGSLNIATFGTKKKDSHGAYASGVYTVPASGQYDIAAQVRIASAFNAIQNNVIAIFIDGANAYQKVIQAVNGVQEMSPSIEVKSVPLLAGQQITIRVATDGPTPSYSSSAVSSFFSIVRSGGY